MSLFFFQPVFAVGLCLFAFMLGACVGSLTNCLCGRSRDNKSFWGRSFCPVCLHKLGLWDLIPVFSFIFLRAECRYCHSKLSFRYLFSELLFGAAFVSILLRFGISAYTLELWILFSLLIAAAIMDIDTFEVPDTLPVAAAILFVLFAAFSEDRLSILVRSLLNALIFGGSILILSLIFDKVYKKDTIGGADIKLIAVLALFFDWKQTLFLIIIACLVGILFAYFAKIGPQKAFPFIPTLVLAAYITLMVSEPFLNWYAGLFGLGEH